MGRVFPNDPGERSLTPGWVTPKTQKMKDDADVSYCWYSSNGPQSFGKKDLELIFCIGKIGLNTQRSPDDLKRLAVAQIPVKDN